MSYERKTKKELLNELKELQQRINVRQSAQTDFNQSYESLEFKNNLFSALQDTSEDGILVVDENGKIISFNKRFVEMWDISSDVLNSRSDKRVLQLMLNMLKDRKGFLSRVQYLYKHPEEKSREEIPLHDGRTFARFSSPVFGSDKKYFGRAWYFRDITEYKHAQTELHSIYDSITDFITVQDTNYRILSYNKTVEKQFGENLAGKLCYKVYQSRNKICPDCPTKKAIETKKPAFRFQPATKVSPPVEINAYPILNEEGKVFAIVEHGKNITEKQKMENDLKYSEKKFRTLFNAANDALFILDLKGHFIDVNKTAYERLGYTKKEMLSMHISQLDPPEFAAKVPKRLDQIKKHGKAVFESAHLKKDGSVMPVEVNSRLIDYEGQNAFFSVIRDITSRKKAERILKESEEKYQKLFNNRIDAICICDIETRRLLDINKAFLKLYGFSRTEALQLTIDDVCAEPEKTHEAIKKSVITEDVLIPIRRHKKKDCTEFYVELSTGPFTWKNKKVIYALIRDITERIQLENERVKTQKLESLGLLAGGIAHDFNNLLQGILGNISLAKRITKPGEKIYELLEHAEKAYEPTVNLTKHLITFSKGGSPVKEIILIEEFIKDVTAFYISGTNIGCEFNIHDKLWVVEADKSQLEQAYSNIVLNARDAMPEGGIIHVSAKNITIDRQTENTIKAGKYVKISIEDNGIGIAKQNLNKIFDPYFSTKNLGNQKGMGLGLSICFSIVIKHHGHITVESKPRIGTTVHLYLPVSEKKIKKQRKTVKSPVRRGNGKILFMDDSEHIRTIAYEMLKYLGYEVEIANDGSEAIESDRQPFRAVILDLTEPGGMGGKATVEKLLKIDPEVKAIVSSGYSNDPIIADFMKYGFCGVLRKPYRESEMGEELHKILADI
jgi:PAS domain S-box-containing protein